MSAAAWKWVLAGVVASGAVLLSRVDDQRRTPLRESLDTAVPAEIAGLSSRDIEIPESEREVAGMTSYIMRTYGEAGVSEGTPAFTLYVGYYDSQTQGKTIHSPRNCLPGAGWEPLAFSAATIATAAGAITVNKYLIQRGEQRALVLYWYQGRGRVAASEYRVKWDLLRDAAIRGRSEEALVRVLVPVRGSEAESYALATTVAGQVVRAVHRALPEI